VAEQAAAQEKFRAGLQACLDGKGWNINVDFNGGVADPFTDQDELARFVADEQACRVSMGYSAESPPATVSELRTNYTRLLDTRACLVAHGVNMAPPSQSEDAWIDAAQTDAQVWHPYNDPAFDALPMDQQNALELLCPQPWSQR